MSTRRKSPQQHRIVVPVTKSIIHRKYGVAGGTLFAMIAARVRWAITTPLCVLHGRPDLAAVRLVRLHSPGFVRQFTMIARDSEYQDLVDRLADAAQMTIRDTCIPAIRRSISLAQGRIHRAR